MSVEPKSVTSSAGQFGNGSEPESIFIKVELLPDCASTGRSEEPAYFFCALCLRECTPDVLVRFSSHQPKPNHMDAIQSQRKLEQLLGLVVALDDGGVVCRTCWKLVDIVGEFQESCLASACYIERFSRGMQRDTDIDNWLSRDVFNSMDVVQKAIRNNRNRMELEQVIAANIPQRMEPEAQMNGFSEDVNVSDNESFKAVNPPQKPVEETETELQMDGFCKDEDDPNHESPKATNSPQRKIAKKGRKKPVEEMKTEVQIDDFSENVDASTNESPKVKNPPKRKAVRKGRKNPMVKMETDLQIEGFSEDVDVSGKVKNPPKRKAARKGKIKPVMKMETEVPVEDISEGLDAAMTLLGDDNYHPTILACEKCGRKFDGFRAHQMHVERCDTTKNTTYFTCTICNATFMEMCGLRYHMNKHNGIRPLKCRKYCDRTFSSHYVRMKHESSICEIDGRICAACGHKLKNELSLKKHIEAVHGEAKHVCATCSKAFRSTMALWTHQRVHSDVRKYPCKVCGKAYKSSYALKVHTRIHTQEKPFACHLCDQAFNYKVSLKAHVERHHGQM